MRIKTSYRRIALIMAILMFSTSIGFSMDVHFCGGKLKSINFFGKAETCKMVEVKKEKVDNHACCNAPKLEVEKCNNPNMKKGSCCHNETLVLESNGDLKTTDFSNVHAHQMIILGVLFIPNFNLFDTSKEQFNYTHYNPPPLIKEISILHQVFRI